MPLWSLIYHHVVPTRLKFTIGKLRHTQDLVTQTQTALESMSPYYKLLSRDNKTEFTHRVLYFNQTTTFNSPDHFEILYEMRMMISAAFVQMSFGLNAKSLLHYNKIHLVPKKYSYKHIDKFFYGDVNPNTQTISLAWPKVLEGLANPYDGINLAIHEFAHCLILEDNLRAWDKIFDTHALAHWKKLGKAHLEGRDSTRIQVLREYGDKNLMELFAVSLEAFFEIPDKLYFESPAYYQSLVNLLKQDPRKPKNPRQIMAF